MYLGIETQVTIQLSYQFAVSPWAMDLYLWSFGLERAHHLTRWVSNRVLQTPGAHGGNFRGSANVDMNLTKEKKVTGQGICSSL